MKVDEILLSNNWQIDCREINYAKLAWLGDAIYELYVRVALFNTANSNLRLHKLAVHYVNAAYQAKLLRYCQQADILTAEETKIVKRALNFRPHSQAKHQSAEDYQAATAFEVLLAYLYVNGFSKRITELIAYSEKVDEGNYVPTPKE